MAVDTSPRLYESKAVGGPLDGIKLGGPLSWNGLIPLPKQYDSSATRYHSGRYVWQSWRERWVWTESEPTTYCRYDEKQKRTIHRWYSTARPREKCLCGKQLLIKANHR